MAVGATIPVAGCTALEGGGDTKLDQIVTADQSFALEMEEGQRLAVEIEELAGTSAHILLERSGDEGPLIDERIESAPTTIDADIPETSSYELTISPDDRVRLVVIAYDN